MAATGRPIVPCFFSIPYSTVTATPEGSAVLQKGAFLTLPAQQNTKTSLVLNRRTMGLPVTMQIPSLTSTGRIKRADLQTRRASSKNLTTAIFAAALPVVLVLITVIVFTLYSRRLDREFEEEIERKIRFMKRKGIPEDKIFEILKSEEEEEEEKLFSQSRNRPKRE
eukprot:TRINITY_DN2876_c0_g1_i1.p1 TRINITY_DN2876_c0_g1~~TRINITY_DN2876_c0_g1_i1.p1  ORF type:complete len:167 (+),score=32.63 TRINITY_DN2876_c0_g1_i1:175-675(+)